MLDRHPIVRPFALTLLPIRSPVRVPVRSPAPACSPSSPARVLARFELARPPAHSWQCQYDDAKNRRSDARMWQHGDVMHQHDVPTRQHDDAATRRSKRNNART
ncbi:hypothetical protein CTheo_8431 [Ceratobasidium theobromae]|uniref:Uncharacterized protein n=1 Tax=Ceratobasidium theobromae TaxID=1582974 RepID=A0A5N5Q8L6_9AGAM|nr:hypothetical protein CTheo_8431 [Ceratobasidium theobromae]